MTTITVSARTHSLVLTKSFAAKAAIFGSDEYKMLQEAKELQAGSASFLEIRSWFLKTFPAIEAFYTKRAKLLEKTAAKPEANAVEETETNAAEETAA